MSRWVLVLAATTGAIAAAPQDPGTRLSGKRITWSLHYAGIAAGSAWAQAQAQPEVNVVIKGREANAPWYGKLYSIDDHLRSTWDPTGGSRHYETQLLG